MIKRSKLAKITTEILILSFIGAIVIGLMTALIPSIKNILKMFEPTIFPTAMSVFFLAAATADVASSGRECRRQRLSNQ